MNIKIKNICAKLKELSLDGFFICNPINITYLIGHNCRDAYVLIKPNGEIFYFTDGRYIEEVKYKFKELINIIQINSIPSLFNNIKSMAFRNGFKKIGFEQNYLSYANYKLFKNTLESIKLIPTTDIIESEREIKNEEEIKKIKLATNIAMKAMKFVEKILKPKIKEIELAGEIQRFIRYNGGENNAFDIIVASGFHSSFPHHFTSQKRIQNNELVLVDLGVKYKDYCSDLTRIFFLGKINSLIKRTYKIVKEAQELAIQYIKPGCYICDLDKKVRSFLEKEGLAKYFCHSLGHGIGLEVHEKPRLNSNNNMIIRENMIFTIEPGIYIPRKFGIRIEDIVLVNKKGCEVLSGTLNK